MAARAKGQGKGSGSGVPHQGKGTGPGATPAQIAAYFKAAGAKVKAPWAGGPQAKQQAKGKGKGKGKGKKQAATGRSAADSKSSASHAFDPTTRSFPPATTPIRHMVPVNTNCVMDYKTSLTDASILFVSCWGGAANPCMLVSYNTSLVTGVRTASYSVLANRGTTTGPTSSKISKVGLIITNSTPRLKLGGRCFIAQIDQRVKFPVDNPQSMTGAQWANFASSLKDLPPSMRTTCDLAEFASGGRHYQKAFHCHVDDEVDYAVFENHAGAYLGTNGSVASDTNAAVAGDKLDITSITNWFNHVGVSGTGFPAELTRPMSTIAVVFETASTADVAQDLTFEFPAQYMTRYPLDTVLGQSAITLQASEPKAVNLSRTSSEMPAQVAAGRARDMKGSSR